jgi:hypothetical protein
MNKLLLQPLQCMRILHTSGFWSDVCVVMLFLAEYQHYYGLCGWLHLLKHAAAPSAPFMATSRMVATRPDAPE